MSIIGWDDNFPKEKFLITPPGNGAWIIKNSYGSEWGDNGFLYVSYYDQSLRTYTHGKVVDYAAATIIENTVPYNKNYQYDITWLSNFESSDGNISYMNVFEALDDDLIGGVGTYFNESGVNYKIGIYVNDELKLTQEGVSPYVGYHTIKLDSYIPIKKGDIFKVAITSNWAPYVPLEDTRVHYTQNISFVSFDRKTWKDAYDLGYIACLKVYTLADDSKIINNENITVDYGSGSYFTVQVVNADGHSVGAGAVVNITINGKTATAITDASGIAKVEITEVPGTYYVTTSYNGQTYKNSVVVKLNPNTCLITQNKDITVDYGSGKYFAIKVVSADCKVAASDVNVEFTINGKTTAVKTDDDGIAKIEITENPGTYVMTTTMPISDYEVNNTVIVKEVPAPSQDDDDKPTPRPVPDVKSTYCAKSTYSPQHVYTLYRAYDMKMICQANVVNLKALMDLFNQSFTNGHLKVYIDGTLVFDGNVDDDLSRVIFEIIEKFLGKHNVTVEFTDSNRKTQTFNETAIIE